VRPASVTGTVSIMPRSRGDEAGEGTVNLLRTPVNKAPPTSSSSAVNWWRDFAGDLQSAGEPIVPSAMVFVVDGNVEPETRSTAVEVSYPANMRSGCFADLGLRSTAGEAAVLERAPRASHDASRESCDRRSMQSGVQAGTGIFAVPAAVDPRPVGQQHLWRAVDQEGEVLDILVQPRPSTLFKFHKALGDRN
jgi:hypothetical protein